MNKFTMVNILLYGDQHSSVERNCQNLKVVNRKLSQATI